MNKAYRIIWSKAKDAWVVTAETVKGKGGPGPVTVTALIAAASLALAVTASHALPTAPQVVSGSAAISTSGTAMTITNSAGAIINWQGFSIGQGESTRFIQPSAASAVLNRITGGDPSKIFGALQSNGKVFLINPNGILFGAGSRVDVNGLVASTLDISNQDFLAGRMKFSAGSVAGKVENQGEIITPGGGQVYLIAPDVTNSGVITAPNGDILLAAGREVLLVDKNNPEIAMVVSAPENQSINLGTLVADAGRIGMYGGIVRQKGRISANSAVKDASGRIFLKATKEVAVEAGSVTTANGPDGGSIVVQVDEGTALVSGTVETKGIDGVGGTTHLLGRQVGLLDDALVDASGTVGGGTVLVGGDYQGKSPLVQNAGATYMGSDAVIKADAVDNGNGGKVILWADDTTRAHGFISVRGGANGGDGGFVETSGKRFLAATRAPDASAPKGKGGMWLLDPNDITIVAGTGATNMAGAPSAFYSTDDAATIGATDIETALASFNVFVTSMSNGTNSEAGNIYVTAPITWTTANTLSLVAENNISVGGAISGTNAALALVATNGTVTQSQPISVNSLVISAADGIILSGANTVNSFNATNTASGGINFVNTMPTLMIGAVTQSGSAPVVIENTGNISLGQIDGGGNVVTLRAHSGAITDVNGSSDNVINSFRVDFNDGSTITPTGVGTSGDAIEIYNAAGDSKVTAQTNTGGIYIEKTSGTFAVDLQGIAHTGNTTGDIVIKSNAGIKNSAGLVTSAGNNGNVTLESLGGPGFVTVNAPINKAGTGTLTLRSYTGTNINIASNIFGNAGNVLMDSGSDISVTSGSISANNIVLSAGNSIADSGVITADTLKISAGGNVSLTGANMVNTVAAAMPAFGNLAFYNNKSLAIGTAGGTNGIDFSNNGFSTINIKTTTGDLTVSQPVNAGPMGGGLVTLDSAGTLNLNSAVTSSYNATPGSIKLKAGAGGVSSTVGGVISGNLEVVSGGDVFLDLAPNVVPILSASVSSGGFSFNNSGSFAVGISGGTTGLTAAAGDINLKAGSPDALLTIGQNVQATSGSVFYVADNLAHNAFTTTSGSPGNFVEVKPYTAATNIEFSPLADAAGYLRLSSGELNFSTPLLKVGNTVVTGNIAINEAVTPVAFNTLSLITSGSISQSAGSAITISGLNADGWGGVSLTEANAVSYLGGHTDSSNNFVFNDTIALTVKEVDTQNGINSSSGNITLTSAVDIKNNIGSPIISTGGTLTANAVSGIILNGNNAAATVVLNNSTSGDIIYDATQGSLSVSASNVSTGDVTIANSGSLVVNNVVTGSGTVTLSGSNNVTLDTASTSGSVDVTSSTGSILDGNGASTNITANASTLSAYSGIGTSGDSLETQISVLTALNSMTGGVYLNNSGALNIASITASASNIKVGNTGGTLTLLGPVTGDTITLFSDTSFYNSYGTGALAAGTRWLVWSANPAADTRGGLTYDFKQYNATEGVTAVAQPTGNGFLYSLAPIVSASLTGTVSRTYDGTLAATLDAANYSVSGAVDGDTVVLSNPVSGSYDTKDVGSGKTVTVSGISVASANNGGIPVSGYGVASSSASGAIGTVTTKPLTVSATGSNKVYDGNTSATASLSDDRVSGDILTLGGTASFSDKNVAAGKTVSVAGINVSGTDAANYSFNTTATTTADITVRPLSTWIGGASGLWSSAVNWDALPDLSNVQAVSIPAGSTVTYDASAGTTNLSSLTAAGLGITGGNLTIASALAVSSSFSQTGGTLSFGGGASATITQASGNLSVPAMTVSSLTLAASAGAISQTGPIIATSLDTSSTNGTVLTSSNQVSNFTASNSSSGNIELTNTASPLNIVAITQSGAGDVVINNTGATITGASPVTSTGSVTLTANSPLTIGSGGITAGGNVTLTAGSSGAGATGDILTINGPVSATGNITLSAGNAIQGTSVPSGGNVTSTPDTNGVSSPTTPTTVELAPTTTQIVTESDSIETTPVAPTGLILVALAEPQEEPQSTSTSDGTSVQQPGTLTEDSSVTEEKDDKNGEGKDSNNKESQKTSEDKKDAKPKKNYCN